MLRNSNAVAIPPRAGEPPYTAGMPLRRPAVAGRWYPSNAVRLRADVERYAAEAGSSDQGAGGDGDLVALVAPHAGLMYSGPVAAHAYRLVQDRPFDTIVLVGPSHHVGFEGVAIWPRGAFDTPLGPVAIDADTASTIAASCSLIHERPEAHAREHSLEMQLPFLATFVPHVPIVPMVMGFQTRETAFSLAEGLTTALSGRKALLIASSDLSHFYDARTAAALDHQVIDAVERLDALALMDLLEQRPDHACGGGPMVAVMQTARALGGSEARVLRYADSGDVSGDKSSVVGYLAAAVWR